jgi:Ca-activated chloride channel family protein
MADWALLTDFHFVRPEWFWALVPATLCLMQIKKRHNRAGNWEQVINPALIPYLMQNPSGDNSTSIKRLIWGLVIAWLGFCIGLAGPTWQKLPQPVHKDESALVLILDLSPSMLAEDVTPSRLVRARYKMIDSLNKRQQGTTGLVVYGGEAHAVSPLTEDGNTLVNLIPTLHPTLLPTYGSNTEDAIATAIQLLANAGYQRGDLLLITDGVDRSAFSEISGQIASAGEVRLHILGVGTAQGAPIPLGNGGFVKDSSGAILIPKLQATNLQQLAKLGNGVYRQLSSDDSDIEQLLTAIQQQFPNTTELNDRTFDLWDDRGFWLIILLIPLLLLSFRRGVVFVLVLTPALFTSAPTEASIWQDLWYTPNQQGRNALDNGDIADAQGLFEDTQWQASAAYKNRDYQAAAEGYRQGNSADDYYNLGNSLARMGDLEGALKAYDQALSLAPQMEDALANRDLVEKLKQQQQNQQDNPQDKQENNQQDQQSQNQQQQAQQDQQQQAQNQQQEQSQEQQQTDQQAQEQQEKQQAQQQESDTEQESSESQDLTDEQLQQQQQMQQVEQWLRHVPDDPGGLLRQKFRYQSQQRALEQRNPKPPNQQERW